MSQQKKNLRTIQNTKNRNIKEEKEENKSDTCVMVIKNIENKTHTDKETLLK